MVLTLDSGGDSVELDTPGIKGWGIHVCVKGEGKRTWLVRDGESKVVVHLGTGDRRRVCAKCMCC